MDEPVKIIHFSDTHFTKRPQFIKGSYSKSVRTINSIAHDFAIFTGDLTQDGLGEEYRLADELRKQIISPKIYWIIGNHDSRSGGFEVWEKMVGPREFHDFDEDKSILFVGLDSCIPDRDEGRFGKEELDYTRKILTKYGDAK
ncbi:MAG: metallophosphoesterase family protein, partial [Candidatus Thorarchaeota archaeon]